MIKIDSLGTKQFFQSTGNSHEVQAKGQLNDFSAELNQNEHDLSMEQLKKLFDRVSEQGSKLTQTPTFEELSSYRDLVRQFIGEAVTHMYSKHSQSGWDNLGRQKVYTTVRKIDGKLEEMAEEIRLGQATALSIASKHDAVRGMLVDLYM